MNVIVCLSRAIFISRQYCVISLSWSICEHFRLWIAAFKCIAYQLILYIEIVAEEMTYIEITTAALQRFEKEK